MPFYPGGLAKANEESELDTLGRKQGRPLLFIARLPGFQPASQAYSSTGLSLAGYPHQSLNSKPLTTSKAAANERKHHVEHDDVEGRDLGLLQPCGPLKQLVRR